MINKDHWLLKIEAADVLLWIGIIIVAVAFLYLCGTMCKNIAEAKGYDKGTAFKYGFFLSIFGLIYYAGMPNKNNK